MPTPTEVRGGGKSSDTASLEHPEEKMQTLVMATRQLIDCVSG